MSPVAILTLLTPLDLAAAAALVLSWVVIGWRIEHPSARRPSVTVLMAAFRRDWMREFLTRENRIFDATVMGNLRQGTSFFASTCLIAIGGLLAVVGNTAPLRVVVQELAAEDAPDVVWQIKLLIVVLFLAQAFLKFVWAHRVFGYCAVVMGSVPNDPSDPRAAIRAGQAAELNIRAALNFTRGLRAMYFALAALAWLLGALALIVATVAVVWLLWAREFNSAPRDILTG